MNWKAPLQCKVQGHDWRERSTHDIENGQWTRVRWVQCTRCKAREGEMHIPLGKPTSPWFQGEGDE